MAEKKVNTEKKVVATAGVFDILRRPIISEKAAKISEGNAVAFEVAVDATKEDVARAVQAIYNVKPNKVNIVVAKGKVEVSFWNFEVGVRRDELRKVASLCGRRENRFRAGLGEQFGNAVEHLSHAPFL